MMISEYDAFSIPPGASRAAGCYCSFRPKTRRASSPLPLPLPRDITTPLPGGQDKQNWGKRRAAALGLLVPITHPATMYTLTTQHANIPPFFCPISAIYATNFFFLVLVSFNLVQKDCRAIFGPKELYGEMTCIGQRALLNPTRQAIACCADRAELVRTRRRLNGLGSTNQTVTEVTTTETCVWPGHAGRKSERIAGRRMQSQTNEFPS